MRRVANRFLEYMEKEKNCSPATVKAYRYDLKNFLDFIYERYGRNILPGDITKEMIRSFLGFLADVGYNKKNSPSSRGRRLATLKSMFKFLHREGLIRDNPAADISTPRSHPSEPSYLTEEEYKRLLNATSSARCEFQRRRDYAIISLFLTTGARLSELIGLNIGDLNLKEQTVKLFRKGAEEHTLPLSSEVIKSLKKYLKLRGRRTRTRALFISTQNKRISRSAVWHLVKNYCHKARIKKERIGPHTLRHTFATTLLFNGENLRNIQVLMNHKNLATTARYLHTQDGQLIEAVNKIKLG